MSITLREPTTIDPHGTRSIGPRMPLRSYAVIAADERDDFAAFLEQHPNVVERVRRDLEPVPVSRLPEAIAEGYEDEGGPCGRCDTCGAPCDENGCTADRSHEIVNRCGPEISEEEMGDLMDLQRPDRWEQE